MCVTVHIEHVLAGISVRFGPRPHRGLHLRNGLTLETLYRYPLFRTAYPEIGTNKNSN